MQFYENTGFKLAYENVFTTHHNVLNVMWCPEWNPGRKDKGL